MEISIPQNVLAIGTRIADALEAVLKHANEDRDLQMRNEEEKKTILREDLAFRREQAVRADAEKEMFLKLMFGGAIPGQTATAPPADQGEGINAATMRRRRHSSAPESGRG